MAIDATQLKARRTAAGLRVRKEGDDGRGRLTGRIKGGPNTSPDAVTDARGRPLRFFMTPQARPATEWPRQPFLAAWRPPNG